MSIQRKLTWIIMTTSSLALLCASAGFIAYEMVSFRRALTKEVTTAADVIAANSTAALAFGDRRAAEEILRALRADERLLAACS
jgi:hypothetical protein